MKREKALVENVSELATGTRPDDDRCWEALKARDASFDGLFFVGVSSTGIYCRAVCSAKTPKRENCTFFGSAAEAEAAGYRPCLKCRPELAPGVPLTPDTHKAVQNAAERIREGADSGNISEIASQQGLSDRQLRRLFKSTYGVTPSEYRNTSRLLLAKELLTDTDLPITRVAYACGFSSVRRFNDSFSRSYSMSPSRFRKGASSGSGEEGDSIVLHLGYRPPYRFDLLIDFLKLRAIPGVEAVDDGVYRRTVRLDRSGPDEVKSPVSGWIEVADEPGRNRLAVTVSTSLLKELSYVVERVRRLFDVDCIPGNVEEGLSGFYELVPEENHIAGIRLPSSFNGFEMAVRAILGQQVTVKSASTMAGRLVEELGEKVSTPHANLDHTFPSPEVFCKEGIAERLGELGVIGQRARAICEIARKMVDGKLTLRPGANLEMESRELAGVKGVGDWTVQYLLMRAYGDPDGFPASDLGVKNAFPDMKPREIEKLSRDWSPWRSYAVMSLWCAPHGGAPSAAKPRG
ncbi:MAG: DNA-3-methyladenine glycosylase 2 family protein [Coriobacteriales bacterium]